MYEGNLTILRGLELSDLDHIMEGFNYYPMRRFLIFPFPVSAGQEEEWIKGTWTMRQQGKGYTFAIETKNAREYIGSISLDSINSINRSASFGIAIYKENNWGKGYGTDAIKVILSFGFDILNLNSINLQVHDFNPRAKKCYEKVGFKECGRYRKFLYIEGAYHDSILMDILKEEYLEIVSKNPDWPKISAK